MKNQAQTTPPTGTVTISIDGTSVSVPDGISVAAAILSSTADPCFCKSVPEDPQKAEPRGPFCLMGVCFDCLVEIDGQPNQQGCLTPVQDGMRVRRQKDHNAALSCVMENFDKEEAS